VEKQRDSRGGKAYNSNANYLRKTMARGMQITDNNYRSHICLASQRGKQDTHTHTPTHRHIQHINPRDVYLCSWREDLSLWHRCRCVY
jgi:choline dehydrogenase-like flavoprotein